MKKIIKIVLIVLFALCFLPMPYSYYEVMRVVSMVGFVYLAYDSYKNESSWLWVYGVSALLINPFYRFYITKNIWLVIDTVWVVLLIGSFWFDKKEY